MKMHVRVRTAEPYIYDVIYDKEVIEIKLNEQGAAMVLEDNTIITIEAEDLFNVIVWYGEV